MTASYFLIQSRPWRVVNLGDSPQVGDLPTEDGMSVNQVAEAVAEALRAHDGMARDVILAIDGQSALTAKIRHQGGRTRQRTALGYQLEESLPISTEELVCDFVIGKHEAFGVAAELAELQPIVAALQDRGVHLRSISPLPLLALQDLAEHVDGRGTHLVLWRGHDQAHVFLIHCGLPQVWRIVSHEPEAVLRECRVVRHEFPEVEATVCVGMPPDLIESIRGALPPVVSSLELDLLEAASRTARRITEGRDSATIELLREPLATPDRLAPVRRPLCVLAASLLFLLASAVADLLIRAERYDDVAAEIQDRQEALFHELYPGQRTPTGVRMRLESEHRKLAGATGKLQGMPKLNSALGTLKSALSPLPDDLRFRVLEIRVDSQAAYLEGEARQHSDADLIAGRLRSSGFEVVPPKTERLADKGVSYLLNARLPAVKLESNPVP